MLLIFRLSSYFSSSIHLVVCSDIEEDDPIFKLNIDYSNISGDRKGAPTLQITGKSVVVQWCTTLTGHEHCYTRFILLAQFFIIRDAYCVAFDERTAWLNALHDRGIPSWT